MIIIKNTIRNFIYSKFTKIGWIPTGIIGSLIAWFITGRDEKVFDLKKILIILGVIIGYLLVILFSIFIKQVIIYVHNTYVDSIYGNIIATLTKINMNLKKICNNDRIDDDEIKKCLKKICNDLKKYFEKRTNAKCGVSIKVNISKDERMESWKFRNICRDDESTSRDTETYLKTDHTVIGNTPYSYVVNQLSQNRDDYVYINNNIPKTKKYLNTSITNGNSSVLPYKSELVYPIIKKNSLNSILGMCGFICIDCSQIDKFEEKNNSYDIAVIENLIDNLYDFIVMMIYTK